MDEQGLPQRRRPHRWRCQCRSEARVCQFSSVATGCRAVLLFERFLVSPQVRARRRLRRALPLSHHQPLPVPRPLPVSSWFATQRLTRHHSVVQPRRCRAFRCPPSWRRRSASLIHSLTLRAHAPCTYRIGVLSGLSTVSWASPLVAHALHRCPRVAMLSPVLFCVKVVMDIRDWQDSKFALRDARKALDTKVRFVQVRDFVPRVGPGVGRWPLGCRPRAMGVMARDAAGALICLP